MRKALLPLILVGLVGTLLTVGCQGLFAPSICTSTVTITDSMTIDGHPTTVDTVGRFKLCAQ